MMRIVWPLMRKKEHRRIMEEEEIRTRQYYQMVYREQDEKIADKLNAVRHITIKQVHPTFNQTVRDLKTLRIPFYIDCQCHIGTERGAALIADKVRTEVYNFALKKLKEQG